MLPLFAPAPAALPAPLAAYHPATALPDWPARVEKLRQWQQRIASGYVTSQKEEALQAEFLTLVFGQALGYEWERPEFRQLLLEKKTNVDGTKPDGALGDFAADGKGALGGPVRAVVELKDARTSLDAKQKLGARGRAETPVEQAFSYPSKMGPSCRWVIVSNFVELRLYAANDQTRAEVFSFRTLPDDPAALVRFFALLGAGQLLPAPAQPDAPLDLALRQRQDQEARISKAFYRDYRAARRDLLDHLIEQNPAVPPLALLGHTQKLLDRIIFVCFCEDKNIIPRQTFRRLLDAVRANVFDPADDKIYRTVRGLFQSIDLGNPQANINRFNGGLFAPDAALDALLIKDRTLGPVLSLERYDFASELNVNILGHIFEQSLADLEAERARLVGEAAPSAKQGKRKQDGIFYTPDYITRYIVQQAVGGWLRERRHETGLDALPDLTDQDRATIGVNQQTKRLLAPSPRVQRHLAAWEAYGQRLRAIRVLDPACGSGAFLNEAFGYLLREGQVVNDALAELRAGQRELFDLDRHILQHNLYGVDLNPESVQITRLSLWLQTANPGRPLTSLDHSIRTGNSLIADPAVAGDRAFDWNEAFPEAFENGGFDVVVGNPPYVRPRNLTEEQRAFLVDSYLTAENQFDLYQLFIEKSTQVSNEKARVSFILPNAFLANKNTTKLRQHILDSYSIEKIVNSKAAVFEDASVEVLIFVFSKEKLEAESIYAELVKQEVQELNTFQQTDFIRNPNYNFTVAVNKNNRLFIERIKNQSRPISDFFEVVSGIKEYQIGKGRPAQTAADKAENRFNAAFKKNDTFIPELRGKNISRYGLNWNQEYISYGPWIAEPRESRFFLGEKLLIRQIPGRTHLVVSYTDEDFIVDQSAYVLKQRVASQIRLKYALTLLNSKLHFWYFRNENNEFDDLFPKIKAGEIKVLPIKPITPADQQPFIALADELLAGHRALHAADADFAALLRAELGLGAAVALSGKLALTQPWKPWSTALEKAIGRPLALKEKAEWLRHFEAHQQAQAAARQHLARRDAALDALVYQLYELTPAEIALVAGGEATTPSPE